MSLSTTMRSTIGAKALMAITGVILIGFVLVHMLGNLQVFVEPVKLNTYAHFLQGLGPGLWAARLGLLAVFVAHVCAAVTVTRANRAARPVQYAHKKRDLATGYAARTMLMSGVIVLLFVVYHLLHFTVGAVDLAGSHGFTTTLADGTPAPDVHRMVVAGFQHVPTAAIYIFANLVLAIHVSHGAASLVQTLGLRRSSNAGIVRAIGIAIGLIVGAGNISMPLAIQLGWVSL